MIHRSADRRLETERREIESYRVSERGDQSRGGRGAVKFTVDLLGTDGTKHHWSFTAKYDGKDNPVTGNTPYGNVVALTRVNPRTIRITTKQDGKVVVNQTIVVSRDGKTRTTTTKGKNVEAKAVDSVSFYEKQ